MMEIKGVGPTSVLVGMNTRTGDRYNPPSNEHLLRITSGYGFLSAAQTRLVAAELYDYRVGNLPVIQNEDDEYITCLERLFNDIKH